MARITVDDCMKHIPNRFQLVLAATHASIVQAKISTIRHKLGFRILPASAGNIIRTGLWVAMAG